MRTRWTELAVRDLTEIWDYLEEHGSRDIARRVVHFIYQRVGSLMEFPQQGRSGRKSGTREIDLLRSTLFGRLSHT